jgi:tRNA dimethylallyltransferase
VASAAGSVEVALEASAGAAAEASVAEVQVAAGKDMQSKLITIVGPTASGKTSFAVRLAQVLDGEIISADSRQIYRGMDIGTGKDISEYQVGEKNIPYHLIDIRAAGEKYTLFDYQHDFHAVLQDILSRNRRPILCGGTGLYVESVLKGYHLPDVPINAKLRKSLEGKSLQELTQILQSYRSLHNTTDTDTAQRAVRAIEIAKYQADQSISETRFPPLESCVLGLMIDRDLRRAKITARLKRRLQEGMIDEIKGLLDAGVSADDLIYYGLEYKYVTLHLLGTLSYEEMYRLLEIAIHQFAKRQMTWFRGMERRGIPIHWIDAALPEDQKIAAALSYLNR